MTMRERAPAQPPDSVDLSATLDLLASLTQYAEAGAIQTNTIAQAAQHALEEHGDRVEVLVAVAKLYLAVGDRTSAAVVLGRAGGAAAEDARVAQLAAEAGIEITRLGPSSEAKPRSGSIPGGFSRQAVPHRREPASDFRETVPRDGRQSPEPPSSRTPVSLRAPQVGRPQRAGSVTVQEQAPKLDTAPPTTPRSAGTAEGPALRPTVRMARVTAAPERRWGKAEGREPFDSKPPSSELPRSARANGGPSSARPDLTSSNPYLARSAREALGGVRSARAATGNLKLLDPNDERRKLDRYELIGEIASGGMATVFLARLAGVAGFQRFFAIKRLHPHLADEQEFIDMFLDEARLAAGIHHPNVVPILEVGTSEAGFYLVMDYIEGDTLSGVTSRAATAGGLPRAIALRVLIDALHGLNAAHDLTDADGSPIDLVHRDCSPQNILVGMDGSSRITDFGVARASSRLTTTRSATVKGKLAYLSPEQATGRGLDRRSDLFGMGVILWEALARRRLFRADTDGATLSRILVEPIPSLAELVPDLPDGLCAVVMKALARDPEDRYSTAAEMADAIEQAVREAGSSDLFVASPRDVAGYMRELFGGEVAARRDAVRTWSQQCAEPPAASGPRSYGMRRQEVSPPPPSTRDVPPHAVDPTRGTQRSLRDLQPSSPDSAQAPSLRKERSVVIHSEQRSAQAPLTGNERDAASHDEPRDDSEWEPDPDGGENPPSSKTEPSAVHQEEAVQERPLTIRTIDAPPPRDAQESPPRDAQASPPRDDGPSLPHDVRQSHPHDVRQSHPHDVRQSHPHDVRQSHPHDVPPSPPRDVPQSLPRDATAAPAEAPSAADKLAGAARAEAPPAPGLAGEAAPSEELALKPVPAKPIARPSRGPSTILLIIAVALIAAAVTAFLLKS